MDTLDIHQVDYCVPQGGILSTLLILIMINYLNKALKFTDALLYADDTTPSYWSEFKIYKYQNK